MPKTQKPIVHRRDHEYGGADPVRTGWEFTGSGGGVVGRYEIKVFPDPAFATLAGVDLPVQVGNNLFVFMAPWDLDLTKIIRAAAYLSDAASGNVVVQVRDVTTATDLLLVPITIEAGELISLDATSQPEATGQVHVGDLIAINVVTAGAGGWGLGVILEFGFG